jgi:hypothetical protein
MVDCDGTQDCGRKETISYERVQTQSYTNPVNCLKNIKVENFFAQLSTSDWYVSIRNPQKIVDLYESPTMFDYRRLYIPSGIAQVQEDVFGGSPWLDRGRGRPRCPA